MLHNLTIGNHICAALETVAKQTSCLAAEEPAVAKLITLTSHGLDYTQLLQSTTLGSNFKGHLTHSAIEKPCRLLY